MDTPTPGFTPENHVAMIFLPAPELEFEDVDGSYRTAADPHELIMCRREVVFIASEPQTGVELRIEFDSEPGVAPHYIARFYFKPRVMARTMYIPALALPELPDEAFITGTSKEPRADGWLPGPGAAPTVKLGNARVRHADGTEQPVGHPSELFEMPQGTVNGALLLLEGTSEVNGLSFEVRLALGPAGKSTARLSFDPEKLQQVCKRAARNYVERSWQRAEEEAIRHAEWLARSRAAATSLGIDITTFTPKVKP